MLDLNSSRGMQSMMVQLSDTVTAIEEGTILVAVTESGQGKVKPSTGATTEIFAGIAQSQVFNVAIATFVEEVTVPATSPYTVTLLKTPTADANIGVREVVSNNAIILDAGSGLATGEWSRVGKVMTFNVAQAGLKVRVTYRYNPTVAEVGFIYGTGAGDGAQSVIGGTGAITSAEYVFTSMFDETDDWWSGIGPIYMGAGGRLTLKSASNAAIRGAYVYRAPSPSSPFLGITIPN